MGDHTSELHFIIESAVIEALRKAVIIIPPDIRAALEKAYSEEENSAAKAQLKAILDNIDIKDLLR